PAMELGSVEAIKELVAAGLGAAIVPRLSVTGAGARTDLRVRSLSPSLYRTLALVLRRDKVPDRGLRTLIELLRALAPRAGEATIGHSRAGTLRRASRSRRRSSP
ncbi:MAG: LysR substrate-binding domain-containing protein, partial [Alphaproteobacteria bacterium]